MPLQTADRLALAHQRELARIAASTQAAAAATARTATPADISGWWAGAADGLLARVSGGYAQARRSSVEFLRRHAAAHGVTLDPVPASMDMTQARTSLRVTGPVAFKTSIAAGADVPHAMRSMSTQLQGSAQRLAMGGDRDTFEQTLLAGRGIIGWRRRLSGIKTCGFCAMLASRGAVYSTRESATVAKDGLRFHDHCHCWAEPLYRHEAEPPEVRELQRQWQHVTAGERGEDKARAWRDHWENHVSPESRGRLGIAGTQTARVEQVFGEVRGRLAELGIPPVRRAIASGLPGFAPQATPVRAVLLRPKTARGVQQVWQSEMRRITGRDIPVSVPSDASVLTTREYAEGVLRGLEAFPDAQLLRIEFVTGLDADEYAHVVGGVMRFNARLANEANRSLLTSSLRGDVAKWEDGVGWSTRGDGTTTSMAVHEFGHIVDDTVGATHIHTEALLRMDTLARQAGLDTDTWVAREISAYAGSDAHEMVAEAFADVMLRGDAASVASRRIFEVLEREYLAGGKRVGITPGVIGRAKAAPKPLLSEVKTSLSAEDQARVRRLTARDPQIFATVQDRLGPISTSGNLSAADAAWLQRIYERDRAFVERAVQEASIKREIAAAAKKAGQTPTEYRTAVAARLRELLADKPIAVRIRDEAALRDVLTGGRFKTQLEGAKRAAGLASNPSRRILAEEIQGIPADIAAAERPVYGYVAINDIEPALAAGRRIPGIRELEAQEDVLSSYGRITIVLRSEVRARTTATVGDSLDEVGFLRPSPVDAPTAESLGFRKLDDVVRPDFTRRGYIEAQIQGGVRADDIAFVVFPEAPDQATIAALAQRQIPWRVLKKGDTPLRLSDVALAERAAPPAAEIPLARRPIAELRALAKDRGVTIPAGAKKPDIIRLLEAPPKSATEKAAEAARAAQQVKTDARSVGEALADVLELQRNQASTRVLSHRAGTLLNPAGPLSAEVRKAIAPLARALQSGDQAAITRAAKALERKFKLTRVDAGRTPQLLEGRETVALDRRLHELVGGQAGAGQRVYLVRPGYEATIDGQKLVLVKAQVQAIPADVIQAAERKALREAARVKAAQIEQATGTANLLAEVDRLLASKAETRVIRQALDRKLIARDSLYAGADPAVLEALAAVADDPVKLRAAITRLGTKAKIKPISKAGTKTKYDADTMEPVGGEIKAGTPVTVVTRGSSVTLPDRTVVQLTKAKVTPVKAAKPGGPPTTGVAQVDALPTLPKIPPAPAAAKAVNPGYGSTSSGPVYRHAPQIGKTQSRLYTPDLGPLPSGAYEENCTNVVLAWDMRMRGYDVHAAPIDILDRYGYGAGRTEAELDDLLTRAYRLPSGAPHGRTIAGQPWRSFADIDAEILRDWPDGARGVITVGKHIFNVTKVGGRVQYIEAQYDANASRVVTSLYKRKYKGAAWSTGVQEAKVVRVDDLVPADGIVDAVRAVT